MSLEKPSVHVRLDPEVHQMLKVLSAADEKDASELAAKYLTKLIVGEFHAFKIAVARMKGLGIEGIRGESGELGAGKRKAGA